MSQLMIHHQKFCLSSPSSIWRPVTNLFQRKYNLDCFIKELMFHYLLNLTISKFIIQDGFLKQMFFHFNGEKFDYTRSHTFIQYICNSGNKPIFLEQHVPRRTQLNFKQPSNHHITNIYKMYNIVEKTNVKSSKDE